MIHHHVNATGASALRRFHMQGVDVSFILSTATAGQAAQFSFFEQACTAPIMHAYSHVCLHGLVHVLTSPCMQVRNDRTPGNPVSYVLSTATNTTNMRTALATVLPAGALY